MRALSLLHAALEAIQDIVSALPAMANLGTRPTVDGTKVLLEVNLFDFSRDIYGHEIKVEFVAKLRDEQKFDGIDSLKAQLDRDARAARGILGLEPADAAGG